MALWRAITLAALRRGGDDERPDGDGSASTEDSGQNNNDAERPG